MFAKQIFAMPTDTMGHKEEQTGPAELYPAYHTWPTFVVVFLVMSSSWYGSLYEFFLSVKGEVKGLAESFEP